MCSTPMASRSKETFPLRLLPPTSGLPVLETLLEFVRRYMEEAGTLRTASEFLHAQWPIAGRASPTVSPYACGAWWELHHDGDWRSAGAHARSGSLDRDANEQRFRGGRARSKSLPYRTRRSLDTRCDDGDSERKLSIWSDG